MRLLFVRHGESEANVVRIFSNRTGHFPLTELGRRQAQALADALAGRDVHAIFTSPLPRALETAQILAERFDVTPEVEPALIEYHVGIYEGTPYDDKSSAHYDAVAWQWAGGEIDACLPGGESCRDIDARFRPFIEQLIDRFAASGATIILVGHGGTFAQALPRVLANLDCSIPLKTGLGNAAYAEAELRDGQLRCLRWGEIALD